MSFQEPVKQEKLKKEPQRKVPDEIPIHEEMKDIPPPQQEPLKVITKDGPGKIEV